MARTIIVTGANGSLALGAIDHLLSNYPEYTAVLTVRDASDADANTKRLRTVIARHPGAKTSIRQLDLSSLEAVEKFAGAITAEVAAETLPRIAGLVCNAFFWNMVGPAELTGDGLEKTLQNSL